ncbi:M78 family metallopeptidase domain-containing protein [Desulfobotulus alkaliphilus]|nr:ImmA/IrrE family metallo-endopeptidase [Desulfobotulus alkaliphilus]
MMKKFELRQSWSDTGSGSPEFSATTARLEIYADGHNLTKNENIWSRSIQDHVLVSTWPLAMWALQNWWRLLYEPLPSPARRPDMGWRMAHGLGAANHGFVWPEIMFASDGENVQIWSTPSSDDNQQSVRYIKRIDSPVSIPIAVFRSVLLDFVSTIESRLDAVGLHASDLSVFFKIIRDEEQNRDSMIYRKLEALMGFDPDECPPETMDNALKLYAACGEKTLSELAPVYGKGGKTEPLKPIEAFLHAPGVMGMPEFSTKSMGRETNSDTAPWRVAVEDARKLREEIGNRHKAIETARLFDLLGIAASDRDKWSPPCRSLVSVGIPAFHQHIKFIPRKRHPLSKRFELARYIGDYICTGDSHWLTNTDLGTARQRYQRAFAAAFLCPMDGLMAFLQDDYSEEAIEDAADHFDVSVQTIASLLNSHSSGEREFSFFTSPLSF